MNSTRRGLFGWLAAAITAPVAAKVASAAPADAKALAFADAQARYNFHRAECLRLGGVADCDGAHTHRFTYVDSGHTHGYVDAALPWPKRIDLQNGYFLFTTEPRAIL